MIDSSSAGVIYGVFKLDGPVFVIGFFIVRLFLGHGVRRQVPKPAPFMIGVALWIIVSCCQTRLVHDANGPVNLVRGARGVRSQLSPPREHLGCALRLLRAWRSPWIRCIECPDAVWHDWLTFLASHGDKKENTGHLVEQPARRRYFQLGNVRPDLLTFMIVQDDVKESVGHPVELHRRLRFSQLANVWCGFAHFVDLLWRDG